MMPTTPIRIAARSFWCLLALGCAAALPVSGQAPTTHRLPLTAENIHWGYYDARIDPVVTIRSGDRVYFENLLARGLERLEQAGISRSRFSPQMLAVEEQETQRLGSHPLNGPIFVEGALPGDVLEVRFVDIGFLATYGVSAFRRGGGTIPSDFPSDALRAFEIDTIARTASMDGVDGVVIPARPFFGSIGVAPPVARGRINSTAPGDHVGNLDNKELVEGSTLYLPVHVAGGLLSIGDGHAAQGDGEVSGTAIETSLYGTLEVILRKDMGLRWPRAETPTHYISMGLDSDLDEAARIATREMVDFLVAEKGMEAGDAYILCSVALDLRVTQLVDGTKGIHGMLAKALFPERRRLDLPPRPGDAPGGAEIAREIRGLDLEVREERVFAEIARGNVPTWLRELRQVHMKRSIDGHEHAVTFWATPDYLAVGSDRDYLHMPLSPQTAQRVADLVGGSLPTTSQVDAIWIAADARVGPDSIAPSPRMTTVPVFEAHDRRVRARRARHNQPPGALVAGHKKDVVLSAELASRPGHVAIYGWHRQDGQPIQPLYTGHTDRWVDYSHGIRLVGRDVFIDGTVRAFEDVLRDERLARVLSDEGVIPDPRYSLEAARGAGRDIPQR